MGSFFIGLAIGFLFGVVASCIVLAKKNLELMNKVEGKVEDTFNESMGAAKAAYNYYKKSPAEREADRLRDEAGDAQESED